jgi:hypothetical protein
MKAVWFPGFEPEGYWGDHTPGWEATAREGLAATTRRRKGLSAPRQGE